MSTNSLIRRHGAPQQRAPRRAFTLIELLIVVAIIAILAAIAVPNFLEAQTRAKVSRVKSDLRTLSNAAEAYYVDNNAYPTGWDIRVDPNREDSHSLFLLSTPIAYMTSGDTQDPFVDSRVDLPMWTTYQWDPMTPDGRMFSVWNQDGSYIRFDETAHWYLLISNGPDKKMGFGFTDPDEPEADVQQRFREADQNLAPVVDTVYDPTNGTSSVGNLYRVGGSSMNAAGRFLSQHP